MSTVKIDLNLDVIIDRMNIKDVQELAESLLDWVSDEALDREITKRSTPEEPMFTTTTFTDCEKIDYYY